MRNPHLGNAISWRTRPIKQISLTAELRRRVHGDRLNRDVKLVLAWIPRHLLCTVVTYVVVKKEKKKKREEERKKKASRDSGTRGN